MKKLVENLLSWCKKSMKMRRCVGKSTAPVTGQSVGQTENAEGYKQALLLKSGGCQLQGA